MREDAQLNIDMELTKNKVLDKFLKCFNFVICKRRFWADDLDCWTLLHEKNPSNLVLACKAPFPNRYADPSVIGAVSCRRSSVGILDVLMNNVPWWTAYSISVSSYLDSDLPSLDELKITQTFNPIYLCKSLEEAWIKLDLLGV